MIGFCIFSFFFHYFYIKKNQISKTVSDIPKGPINSMFSSREIFKKKKGLLNLTKIKE